MATKLPTNKARNAGRSDKEPEERSHVSTFVRKHIISTFPFEHLSTQGTLARKHARHVGTCAHKARNLADSFIRKLIVFAIFLYHLIKPFGKSSCLSYQKNKKNKECGHLSNF